ncbi:Cytochrome c3, 13 kDa [compost metagenome]
MRKWIVPLGLVCVFFAAAALVAAPASQSPDKVTIDDCVAKKAAVAFPHGEHAKTIACATCHHTQQELKAGAAVEVQTCGSCHTTPEKAETPKCSEMSMAKNPFHDGCVNCHKEEVKKDAASKAPTKCDQCHPKA